MKIIWICNFMLPKVAEKLQQKATNKEGWLVGLSDKLMTTSEISDLSLVTCFPVMPGQELAEGEITYPQKGNMDTKRTLRFYAYPENNVKLEVYQPEIEDRLEGIFAKEKPDVIHIFGTEYPHALAAMKAAKKAGLEEKVLVGIQGYMRECAKAYMADLPKNVINRRTFRDILKKDSIVQQKEKFEKRAEMEKELLSLVFHITGRTEFDHETTLFHKDHVQYHFMNETLRGNFYTTVWKEENCEPYRIFCSQGNYPLKGAHKLIEAVGELKGKYPEIKLVIAGDRITAYKTLKDRIKISSYGKYLRSLVQQYKLEDQVVFTGSLSAEEMKEQYLNSFLFVSPSSIENSPNSVGEAMLLGMPVISSDVGGVRSVFSEKEGYLYPFEDIEALKKQIELVFEHREEAISKGKAARERALRTHDGETNFKRLLEIYQEIHK